MFADLKKKLSTDNNKSKIYALILVYRSVNCANLGKNKTKEGTSR